MAQIKVPGALSGDQQGSGEPKPPMTVRELAAVLSELDGTTEVWLAHGRPALPRINYLHPIVSAELTNTEGEDPYCELWAGPEGGSGHLLASVPADQLKTKTFAEEVRALREEEELPTLADRIAALERRLDATAEKVTTRRVEVVDAAGSVHVQLAAEEDYGGLYLWSTDDVENKGTRIELEANGGLDEPLFRGWVGDVVTMPYVDEIVARRLRLVNEVGEDRIVMTGSRGTEVRLMGEGEEEMILGVTSGHGHPALSFSYRGEIVSGLGPFGLQEGDDEGLRALAADYARQGANDALDRIGGYTREELLQMDVEHLVDLVIGARMMGNVLAEAERS